MNETLINRLSKILAYAERGVAGEQYNAKVLLSRLLARHGLTMDALSASIDAQEEVERLYPYKSKDHLDVISQCCFKLTNRDKMSYTKVRGVRGVYLTLSPLDHMELSEMVDYYWSLLSRELAKQHYALMLAFFHRHDLFSQRTKDTAPSNIPDDDVLRRARQIHAVLEPANFVSTRRRIAHTESVTSQSVFPRPFLNTLHRKTNKHSDRDTLTAPRNRLNARSF
jgi:hypothetical protein